MYREPFKEEEIFATGESRLADTAYETIKNSICYNEAVGFIIGHYDENLTIAHVSTFFLYNLGYGYDEFLQASGNSLKKLFCGENISFLELERFKKIRGIGEGRMLTRGNVPVCVRMYKSEIMAADGEPMWVLSTHMDRMQQNLQLVNRVIKSGFWSIDCDEQGRPKNMVFSHDFRVMLGCNDVLDFPNTLQAWEERIHPDDREREVAALANALKDKTDGTKFDTEYRMRLQDGTYHWFRDSGEVTRRADGTAYHMAGIFVDIQQRKEEQRRMRRSDAFHRAYTAGNLCEYYVDLERNTFESLKAEGSMPEALENCATWDDLVRAYLENYIVPQKREAVGRIFDRGYIAEKLAGGQNELSCESRIVRNGETRWVRNVVFRDSADDSNRYAMILVRDITDAKKEEAHLRELADQNEALDMLVRGTMRLVDRYAMCDLKSDRYRFFSRLPNDAAYAPEGAYRMFIGEIAEEFKAVAQGDTLENMLCPENLREMLRSPDDIYRIEYCTMDEKQFKTLAITPLSWSDGVVEKVLLIAQDVTQEKVAEMRARQALKDAYETANRASRAKTEFLSNMSHDIRTPMNAIIGMTAIAGANIKNTDRVVDCLGKITQSSRHLLSLINEVLDMSRIESGKIALSEEEFNLSDLVDNLVTMSKSMVDEHHHTFDVKINHIQHEDVCGDSMRIQQLVTNILSNAIKYTPDGGHIQFSISELPCTSAGLGCYQFVVQDNGIGMSPEFQKIMFEPFARADDKRTSKIQGTGLGMAIAHNFVTMMGGDIKVDSALGKGSKFTCTIFLKLQHRQIAPVQELINLPVLVVDDDKDCCETTTAMLKEIGIDGEWVTTGAEAVQRAEQRVKSGKHYFAVIIDWKMPGMDGIETTRRIRKIVGPDVTIIILSAYDYAAIEKEARAAGVDDFIAKPLFRSRLTAALKNALGEPDENDPTNYLTEIAESDYSGKRILLVEDNDLNREIACEIIGMSGATIENAENGQIAVDKFAAAPVGYYDLIFMDIQMPVMNGYEATAAIRSMKRADAATVPIIAMTANAFAEDVQLAKNAGMNEHASKPLDVNRLNEILHRWL